MNKYTKTAQSEWVHDWEKQRESEFISQLKRAGKFIRFVLLGWARGGK